MNFAIVHNILSFFRQTTGRLIAVAIPKNIKKDEVTSTVIAVNETKLNVKEDTFHEFYVSRITENDENKVVLCRNRQEMEELLFSDLNHCIVASKSFITEILRERELQAKGIEPPLMDIADLNKNMLRVHRRANRYVFPIASDPDFQISVDYCFVEPEINENDARKKDGQTRARYWDILGCLETDPNIKRILILGEFGSGKNTLCVKMVMDIMNDEKFRFLEDKLNYKLFIACDLSKFRDWDKKKSLDDILLKFCHSYSTNSRLESTKKLIQQYSSNILCIFSGYENLTTTAKEKVDFVLKRENKQSSVFGDSTIVLATCTDPAFTPCFLTYFEKFFVLSRIKRTNVDTLLQKLFEGDIEEKNVFVENMKKMYLSFLLEISPLILIYCVYVYKQYGASDRNQFVIELVYLMKDNKRDSRSFQNHQEHIAKLLRSTVNLLPNMTGRNYGGFKNSKATECYEYLTNKRQRMDGMVIGSLSAKGSTIFNHKSLMTSDYEHILDIYNQQLRVQASFTQNFHQIYSVEKQKITAMDELIYYSEKLRKERLIQNMELVSIQDTKSQFLTSLARSLARVEVLNQDYSFTLVSSVFRDIKDHVEDFKVYITPLRVCRHLSEIPLAFFVMFYVFRSFENKPPNKKVFLRDVCHELMNCVRNPLENPNLSQREGETVLQSTTSPTELIFSLR